MFEIKNSKKLFHTLIHFKIELFKIYIVGDRDVFANYDNLLYNLRLYCGFADLEFYQRKGK